MTPWNALEEVTIKHLGLVENLEEQLDYELLERSENLSVGERQLICLGCTLLQQRKIVFSEMSRLRLLILTDRVNILYNRARETEEFHGYYSAHRLNSVQDCDKILVLKKVRSLTWTLLIPRWDKGCA